MQIQGLPNCTFSPISAFCQSIVVTFSPISSYCRHEREVNTQIDEERILIAYATPSTFCTLHTRLCATKRQLKRKSGRATLLYYHERHFEKSVWVSVQFSSVETVSRRRPESKLPAFERGRCGTGLSDHCLGSWLWQRSAAIYEA